MIKAITTHSNGEAGGNYQYYPSGFLHGPSWTLIKPATQESPMSLGISLFPATPPEMTVPPAGKLGVAS